MIQKFLIIIFSLFVVGCSFSSNKKLAGHADDLKSHNHFGVCYGYGCKYYQKTGLTDQEWQNIKLIFFPEAESPQEEREMIAKAIARIEQYIGPKTGTDNDDPGAQIINFDTRDQMDCIDEAFNTTSYLYLLQQDGLIKMHELGRHYRRGFKIGRWAHSTATIHEKGMERIVGGPGHYAVDSWFHKNGALAEIVPAADWIKGWSAPLKRDRYNFSAS